MPTDKADDDEVLYDYEGKMGDAKIVAASILEKQKGSQMSAVHSVKSLSKVVEKVRDEVAAGQEKVVVTTPPAKPKPLIVVHVDRGEKRSEDPSNLPYLHRNPAV